MIKFLACVSLTLATLAATASASEWNMNGSSCTADPAAIQGNLYLATSGTVKFASAKTGQITLYCPVPANLGFTPTTLGIMFYDDTGGAGSGEHVTASLVRMPYASGSFSTTNFGTIDTNGTSLSTGGLPSTTSNALTGLTWTPASNSYWIRVDLFRTATTSSETIYAVSLAG